jgi:serine protease Do
MRKKLAAAAMSGAVIAGLFGTSTFVRDTHAQDTPAQGKVQAPVQASAEEQRHLDGLASIFKKVGKSVEPAVVKLDVIKSVPVGMGGPGGGPVPRGYDDMLREFFGDRDGDGEPDVPEGLPRGGGRGSQGDDEDRAFRQQGTGSGVVMEVNGSDAYILTNNHVAGGATEIQVTLSDGRVIEEAKVVGTDPKTDLAVVKVKADGLVAAPWGDSDKLEKGDWIMAFGSPFGYVGSMTHGIVSALNRQARILGPNGYENFIQVDAPINPGNSGGPLVNTRGEVVGINTAIASRSGGFQGVGFAVPSNQAKFVYTSLKTNGKVTRGYIGVSIQDASLQPDLMRTFGYDKREGVLVRETGRNSPATGKLREGDVITAIAGKPIKDSQELRNTVAATPPGTDLKMTVFREGKNQEVVLKIAEQPEDLTVAMYGNRQGDPAARSSDQNTGSVMGMKLATPNEQLATEYGLGETRQGAVVTEVDPKSAAGKAGLTKGDVITRVVDEDVLTAKQAADAIRKQDATKPIRLYVTNAEGSRFVVIRPESK